MKLCYQLLELGWFLVQCGTFKAVELQLFFFFFSSLQPYLHMFFAKVGNFYLLFPEIFFYEADFAIFLVGACIYLFFFGW